MPSYVIHAKRCLLCVPSDILSDLPQALHAQRHAQLAQLLPQRAALRPLGVLQAAEKGGGIRTHPPSISNCSE